jgi:hypothetical protein
MELSHEDQLRLNVMLANPFDAIRIDDSRMSVHALTGEQEARVQLNPTGRGDAYLKQVRELLSGHALGSPGGYPVYLKRWTRMGQARAENLSELLKLGEPEAFMAVAGAHGLTNELARCVWWANPTASIARSMLEKQAVISGTMGKILAQFLIEHLPFETESELMIESVRLVLQPGLIDQQTRLQLWNKGKQKKAYHIGFLSAAPDNLPEKKSARTDYEKYSDAGVDSNMSNPFARLLEKLFSENGQSFLSLATSILTKPANQDDVVILLNTIKQYFNAACLDQDKCQDIEKIIAESSAQYENPESEQLAMIISSFPELKNEILAMLVLARCDEAVVTPVFAKTTAIGTLMRKKIAPVTDQLLIMFSHLNPVKL